MADNRFIYTNINEIHDEPLLGLVKEIFALRNEDMKGPIIQFLISSMNTTIHHGERCKKKFDRKEVASTYYLYSKIGELFGTGIYFVFQELIAIDNKRQLSPSQYKALEDYHKTAVYVLLNKFIPDNKKKKPKRKL